MYTTGLKTYWITLLFDLNNNLTLKLLITYSIIQSRREKQTHIPLSLLKSVASCLSVTISFMFTMFG